MNLKIRILINIIIKTIYYLILQKKFYTNWKNRNSKKEYFRTVDLQKIKQNNNNFNNNKKNEEIYQMF